MVESVKQSQTKQTKGVFGAKQVFPPTLTQHDFVTCFFAPSKKWFARWPVFKKTTVFSDISLKD